ncbi:MAG: glycosyltransferase family 87 protein [Opitutaceae bacterium]
MPARVSRAIGWSALYLIFVAAIFNFPTAPGSGLDPSWRMVLGYIYEHGMQFGKDVIFTYGPLGFVMGKTFSGLQFWSLIIWQLVLAFIAATVIFWQGRRLSGPSQLLYYLYFATFGIIYEDALHMIVIVLLGFDLLRHAHERWRYRTALIAAVLALYAEIKFTDLMLGTFVVLVASAYSLWFKRWRESVGLVLSYVGCFLAIWLLCGQHLANLPGFFEGSWSISQGYQWAMEFPSPLAPLWKAVIVLLVIVAYAFAHLKLNPDKPRAVANVAVLAAFIFLNWKHGFVRSDGHMIGFFFCAMIPMVTYPTLLDDPDRFRRLHRWTFIAMLLLSVWGIENALWGVSRGALGQLQARSWSNIESVIDWKQTRQKYRDGLAIERSAADMYQLREEAGDATVDILGVEQSVALMNRLNYRPRPVIQSYSTFTPLLARLNYDFYASDAAPEYVLLKIQTIDGRLPTMDDSMVLSLLVYRYHFVRIEKGFLVWKKNPGPFNAAKFAPKLVRSGTAIVNQPFPLGAESAHPLWLKIDLKTSLLGTVRSFLYKPPQVMLKLTFAGATPRTFLMPLPMGRTGFIVNPFIDDAVSYMEFAASRSQRMVSTISIEIAPSDQKYFADSATFDLSELPAPNSGGRYFSNANERLFHMFKSYPISYDARMPFSETTIEGREVAVMHAPSEMIFDMPRGAKKVKGRFGFVPGAYSNGGRTNGAEFVVYWSNGTDRVDLFDKFLDPLNHSEDTGLQVFDVDLVGLSNGRIYLQVKPGPYNDYSWDWTGWTDVEIK